MRVPFKSTDNFENDVITARAFVRNWAAQNGLDSDASDEELQHELASTVAKIQKFPLSFNKLKSTQFIRRARCFHDIFAIEYMILPTNAQTAQNVSEFILGALIPLKSGRSQHINIPQDVLDLNKD